MRPAIGLAVVASVLLVGCYGETQPATDLRPNFARLHGQFTANNGPASGWFEYWATSDPDHKWQTAERHWAAGESGPVEADAPVPLAGPPSRLRYGTSYSFHLCGRDGTDTRDPSGCAQTQTFTTPVGDGVEGAFAEGFRFGGTPVHVPCVERTGRRERGRLAAREGFLRVQRVRLVLRDTRRARGRRSGRLPAVHSGPRHRLAPRDGAAVLRHGGAGAGHLPRRHHARDVEPARCASASFDNLEPPDFIGVGFIQDAPPAG